jgi:enoyl-CoA hydratase/carnithine racemase
VLQRLLDLPMPVVAVANGPATVHSEICCLPTSTVPERATYCDLPHTSFGITAGDGVHVVWEEVARTARAKWLLWTGQQIDAQTALQWDVVSEVVPHERALDRGIEIASALAAKPPSIGRCKSRRSISSCVAGSPRTFPSGWRSKV